jgi:hypothetical protein
MLLLLLALLLVVVALGSLVAAVVTAGPWFAWVSVAASVAAAVVLVMEWRRNRRAVRRAEESAAAGADARLAAELDAEFDPVAVGAGPDQADRDVEPAEEDTDAADLLLVTELAVEVRVLDERPRYHLARCGWLGDRESLPLPVCEARELGFTPCAVCAPDGKLAARERERRRGAAE